MSKQQTAVEWLYDEIKHIIPNDFLNKFEDAKVKEREQIRSAYIDGQDDVLEKFLIQTDAHLNSLHYYNRTYKIKL